MKRLEHHQITRFRDQTTLLDVTVALIGVVALAALTFSLASEYLKDQGDERQIGEWELSQRSFDIPLDENARQLEKKWKAIDCPPDPLFDKLREPALPRGTTGLALWP